MTQALTIEAIRERRERSQREIEDFQSQINALQEKIDALEQIVSDANAAERLILYLDEGHERSVIRSDTPDTFVKKAMEKYSSRSKQPQFFGGGEAISDNPFRHNTIKSGIWEILKLAPSPWLTANEIQMRLSKMRGSMVPMTSISPILSDMKDEYIVRDNLNVALKSRVERKDPATEAAGS